MSKKSRARMSALKQQLADAPAAAPDRRLWMWGVIALIAALGLLAYANVLKGAFVWDDEVLVAKDAYIRDFAHLKNIFSENILGGVKRLSTFYRPLQILSYAVDFSVWKLDPFGYHLTNVLIHVAAAAALYFFLMALVVPRRASLWAALLFVVHPVHTEAVSYVSGRADPLAAVFVFLCLALYVRRRGAPGVLVVLCSFAALLSKEIALLLPLMALLYHVCFRVRVRWSGLACLVVPAAVVLVLRHAFSQHIAGAMDVTMPLPARVPGAFAAYAQYLRLLVWPTGLHMEYGQPRFSWANPWVGAGIILFILTLVFVLRTRRRAPLLSFGAGWYLLTVAPVLNIFPVNAYMAEHWLYLPAAGFFLAAAVSAERFLEGRPAARPAVLGVVCTAVLCLFALTVRQNRMWREPELLYESILAHAPASARLLNNLGNIYAGDPARREEAAALYARAIETEPGMSFSYFNLANLEKHQGRIQLAIDDYKKAIERNPAYVEAYSNLGVLYFGEGRYEEAAQILKAGADLNFAFPDIYHNLGNTYEKLGRHGEAIAAYGRALGIDPDFAPSFLSLAFVYFKSGDPRRAAFYALRARTLGESVPEDLWTALLPFMGSKNEI
ncbi:MAG: tetratricopeptide repeat protein [Deltaproteobacteria bacterium]